MQVLYRIYDSENTLLYVGISGKWYERFHQHEKQQPWWGEVATIKLERFESREQVSEAEKIAILNEKPLHNRQHSFTFEGLQEHFNKLKFYTFHNVPVDEEHKALIEYARDYYEGTEFFVIRGKRSIDFASILESGFFDVPESMQCVNCQALNSWKTLKNWSDLSFKDFVKWDYEREVAADNGAN